MENNSSSNLIMANEDKYLDDVLKRN